MVYSTCQKCGHNMKEIICPYIMKKGKRIYPTSAKAFRFFICEECRRTK